MGRQWRALQRPGERELRWRGLGVEDAYGRRGEREARCCSWGEGDVDMGRQWRAWRRLGERERRRRGLGVEDVYGRREEREARGCWWGEGDVDMGRRWPPEERERRWRGLGGRGGVSGSWSGAVERLRRSGAVGSGGAGRWCTVWGGSRSAAVCGTGARCGASCASQEASAGPGGPRVVPPGSGGGGSPPTFVDLPTRGAVAVAACGTGGVAVPGGGRPRGPLPPGCGGRADTVLGRGGGGPWW